MVFFAEQHAAVRARLGLADAALERRVHKAAAPVDAARRDKFVACLFRRLVAARPERAAVPVGLETVGAVPVVPDLARQLPGAQLVVPQLDGLGGDRDAKLARFLVVRDEDLRFRKELLLALDQNRLAVLLVFAIQPRRREETHQEIARPRLAAPHAVGVLHRIQNVLAVTRLAGIILAIRTRHAASLDVCVRFAAHAAVL